MDRQGAGDEAGRGMSTRHTNLLNAICDWLRPMPDVWHLRIAGSPSQRRGVPDILVIYKGRLLCFEGKIPPDKLSASQKVQKARLERVGVPVIVVETKEEAMAAFDRFAAMVDGRAVYDG